MLRIFTDALTIFLVTYALIDILSHFLNFLLRASSSDSANKKILLYCESDESIESMVRSTSKITKNIQCEILIQLKKETEDTELIINQLRREFPYLKTVNLPENIISLVFEDASSKNE